MIGKSLDQITRPDLESLLTEKTSEGRTLDYKRDLNLAKDEDKRELARDVSSLANAAGGDLVYGIEEAKDADGKNLGIPESLVGVDCPNFDATKLRFENIVRDLLDPRVQGIAFHKVDGFARGPIIIVRVPKSWIGPHMVTLQSQTDFYSRNSAGRQPLDVREIRAAFLAGTETATRIQRFRDHRIGQIIAGETPVPLRSGAEATVVIHVVPIGDREATSIDLVQLETGTTLRPPSHGNAWSNRFNLDGFVVFCGPEKGGQRSYAQVFRDGAIEGVALGYRHTAKDGPPQLSAIAIETTVVESVESFFKVLRANHFEGPVSVLLTVLGVRGTRIFTGGHDWGPPDTIDRDTLVLPDVVVERLDADPRAFLRATFDALWQSSGLAQSRGYDPEGNWSDKAHG